MHLVPELHSKAERFSGRCPLCRFRESHTQNGERGGERGKERERQEGNKRQTLSTAPRRTAVFFNQPVILRAAGRRSQLQAGEKQEQKGGEFSV